MFFRGMFQPFFFEATATNAAYLTMLEHIIPCIDILFSEEDCCFQHYGAPLHYHTNARNFLAICLEDR
jgi:hypothetical protein